MDRIGFILLHYGDISVTKECTDSILQLEGNEKFHIVVVDNDCHKSDEERKQLKGLYTKNENITVLKMTEDRGFSFANNQGFRYLKEHYKLDYIVVSNNDIIFCQKDFSFRLQRCYQGNPFSVLAPDIIGREDKIHQNPIDTGLRTVVQTSYTIAMNTICLKLFPIVYPFIKGRFQKKPTDKAQQEANGPVENIVPCGACLILSREFINHEAKVFYPETRFYYEEYILYYNCQCKGYRILYDPSIKVLHGDGVATKKQTLTDKGKMKFIMKHTIQSAKIYKKLICTNKK